MASPVTIAGTSAPTRAHRGTSGVGRGQRWAD